MPAAPDNGTSTIQLVEPKPINIEDLALVADPTRAVASESPLLSASPATSSSTSAWSRAAQALQHGDKAAADEALSDAAQSTDKVTRDSALLARAELWISTGDQDKARSVLAELAVSGATPLIRKRASALLSR
jgi:thioredoxin-like negative regulator of GroEL